MVVRTGLFDTNILIDYLIGRKEASRELKRYTSRSISVITWMEVMAGVTPDLETSTLLFLGTFSNLPITQEIAAKAVTIRRDTRLKLPDAIILATAEIEDLPLITRNTRDFPVTNPRIRVPYTL